MEELNLVEKVIALEGVDLLSGLTPEQVASVAMVATEVHFPSNRTVLDENGPVDALYVVVDGSTGYGVMRKFSIPRAQTQCWEPGLFR